MPLWIYSIAMCALLVSPLPHPRRVLKAQPPTDLFSLHSLVSMPKQLAIVYLGYMVRLPRCPFPSSSHLPLTPPPPSLPSLPARRPRLQFGVNHETATPSQVRQQKIISLSVLFATGIATVLALYITYMRARRLYPEVLRDMEEAKVAQSPLADGSAPPGLARRRSLVEAAFEGEPGVAEVEGRGYGYRRGAAPGGGRGSAHGMGRTRAGARWGAEGGAEADDYEGDDWDAKSPAMRGQRPHGDMRDKLAWQDGRAYVEQAPTLRYGGGGARADDEDDGGDPASSYAHLPLASESEVGAYGQAHGAGTGAGVGGPARGPYEDPFEAPTEGGNMAGVGVGSKGGRYGALGRSR